MQVEFLDASVHLAPCDRTLLGSGYTRPDTSMNDACLPMVGVGWASQSGVIVIQRRKLLASLRSTAPGIGPLNSMRGEFASDNDDGFAGRSNWCAQERSAAALLGEPLV